jgi:ABC-type bacteriocin/lantibiotic exporter with double-glycine peptidase domain
MQHLAERPKKSKSDKPKVTMASAFKTIIWPRRKLVFIGLVLIVIRSLSGLILPWQSKVLLDDVVPNKNFDGLYTLIGIVLVAILVQAVTSFLLTRILSVQAQYLISELRAQVQKKVLSLPISFFDNTKSGALVSRIMNDVEGVRNLIGAHINIWSCSLKGL